MKKLILYLFIMLTILYIVSAEVRIDEIKFYVNNERVTDADKDGGTVDVKPGDTMEVITRLENIYNFSINARLRGRIRDISNGDDLTKEQDWYEILANDDKAKTLTFNIPSDAVKDTYTMEFTVYHKYNGSEYSTTIDYDIDVRTAADLAQPINLQNSFSNMTKTCNDIISNMNICFGYIDTSKKYMDEASTCKEERGGYLQGKTNCESSLSTCNSEKSTIQGEKAALQTQASNMKTSEACEIEKKASASSTNTMWLMIAGGGGILWFIWDRKRKRGTVPDSFHTDYDKY